MDAVAKPRMRWDVERWNYANFNNGTIERTTWYTTEHCTDVDINRMLDQAEQRRYLAGGKKLVSRTWERSKRYIGLIKVTAVYEVNA